MNVDTQTTNPYESPRGDERAVAGTARRWKYHCPECDAVCLRYWQYSSRGRPRLDKMPPFPCASCGAMLLFQNDEKRAVRKVALQIAVAELAITPLFLLWICDLLDILIVLPCAAAVLLPVLWARAHTDFKSFHVWKIPDTEVLEGQPIAVGSESTSS